MIYFILWCFNGFGGIYGDICETNPLGTCQEILYSSNAFSIQGFPNVEQIKYFCPSLTNYLNCIEEYRSECDFEEFGIFSTEEEFIKVNDFIADICNINSSLHKKYTENAECLSSLNENLTECTRGAAEIYQNYADFKKKNVPERDEPYTVNNPLCVSKSYSVMCAAMKTLAHCGPEAHRLSLELINRSNFLQNFCKRMELYDIQTSFMDFLQVEDEERELMRSVFIA